MSEEKKTILERMIAYIDDALEIAVYTKGDALMRGNMHAYTSAQGAIDILLDLQSINGGKEITTIAEMREDIKKASEKEGAGDKEMPYQY